MAEDKVKQTDLVWEAPARPFKKRDRGYFQTIGALVFLLVALSLFFKDWWLVAAILAVFFVSYAVAAIKPGNITYKITAKGLWVGEHFYPFEHLYQYWFERQFEQDVVVCLCPERLPNQIVLVLGAVKKEIVDARLKQRLVFREAPLKTFADKLSDWLRKKLPLEEKA